MSATPQNPFSLVVEEQEQEQPVMEYVFGGRLDSSEYVKINDEKGQPIDVHKVHLDLVLSNEQYIQLLTAIGSANPIKVMLV